MKMIPVECPACRSVHYVAASCLLLEVGSASRLRDSSSSASWICDTCHDLVGLPLDLTVVISLIGAGASVLDPTPEADTSSHPEGTIDARAFTHDDLLDFHELMDDEDRVADALNRLSAPGDRRGGPPGVAK